MLLVAHCEPRWPEGSDLKCSPRASLKWDGEREIFSGRLMKIFLCLLPSLPEGSEIKDTGGVGGKESDDAEYEEKKKPSASLIISGCILEW